MSRSARPKSNPSDPFRSGSGTPRVVHARAKPARRVVARTSPLSQPSRKAAKRKEAKVLKAAQARKPRPSAESRDFLEPDEVQAFFKVLPVTSFWYAYYFIEYFFGCRLSEPALILDDDCNVKKKQITIKRLKRAKEKDGYREHLYKDLDDRVLKCIDTALRWKKVKKNEENPFVFASSRNRKDKEVGAERLSQLRNHEGHQAVSRFTAHRMFRRIAQQIKLPEHLQHSHVFRSTRAVLMLAEALQKGPVDDESLQRVSTLLGHTDVKATQKYLKIAQSMKAKFDPEFFKMGLGI